MLRVLVPTHAGDVHAIAVQLAMARQGHDVRLWMPADFPTRQHISLSIEPDQPPAWRVEGEEAGWSPDQAFNVVWARRPYLPVVEGPLHPGDRLVAEREARHLHRALWNLTAPDAFWVNPFNPRAAPPTKPVQLVAARDAGLRVPATLFSNDPARVRSFLERRGGSAIYKPFNPVQWRTESGVAHLFSSELELEALPEDDEIRLCPGVYQERVSKAYEVRVTWMGATPFVVRLDSQSTPAAVVDWRGAGWEFPVSVIQLPPSIIKACQELMGRLGLVFGCLDFIVTPGGDWVFLEVNEMGQFLWLEERLPDLPLLDAFCALLESRSRRFVYSPRAGAARYETMRDEVERRARAGEREHVAVPEWTVSD